MIDDMNAGIVALTRLQSQLSGRYETLVKDNETLMLEYRQNEGAMKDISRRLDEVAEVLGAIEVESAMAPEAV